MNLRLRSAFFIVSGFLILLFLYIERSILTPFILAAIFAYIFNPLINFFSKIFKFPRVLSIILVYIILIFSVLYMGGLLTRELIRESASIRQIILDYISYLRSNVNSFPPIIQPLIFSYSDFSKLQIKSIGLSAFPIFSLAFSGILNFFVFIFATFFFLKDSEKFVQRLLLVIPDEERLEITALIKKINTVLSKYLRGQIILIVSLAVILFAGFSFLGVKNALTISILSAVAGVVPIIGTITAVIVGTFIIVVSGGVQNFTLGIMESIGIVVGVYYASQLIQDYILSPLILGKAVRLHPLVILFAALAGGNLAGIMGLILAVPIAATLKIIFEFALDKINHRDYLLRKGE